MVTTFLTVIHIMSCILLVLVILIQSGKGAEISASFGGSSQTIFGTSGGANFLTRLTAGTAGVFMLTSVLLTILSTSSKGLMDKEPLPVSPPPASSSTAPGTTGANESAQTAPAKPAAPVSAPVKK